MDAQQAKVVKLIAKALFDTIKEFPQGAPSGVLYMAMSEKGCSLAQYQGLIEGMKVAGLITQKGDLLFAKEGMSL